MTVATTADPYTEFLATKRRVVRDAGFAVDPADLNPMLFPFQTDIVRWALRKGRAAVFADCGLGKGPISLEWARQVHSHSGGDVLILAPLAVAQQFVREAAKFHVEVTLCRTEHHLQPGINVTNYERLHLFDPERFAGVVADEASILKSMDGKTRNQMIEMWHHTPFRLAGTATPAPNDHVELGNQAEFLGVCTRQEMLAEYFCHDGGDTSKWRLKGHAEAKFWEWVCSWAVLLRKPSDLGYSDDGFILPPLNVMPRIVESTVTPQGMLFPVEAQGLNEQRQARRDSLSDRVQCCFEVIQQSWANQTRNIGESTTPSIASSDWQTSGGHTKSTEKSDLPNIKTGESTPTRSSKSVITKSITDLTQSGTASYLLDNSSDHLGSLNLTSLPSLHRKMEDAPFAEEPQGVAGDSISITTTQQEGFEESSVTLATNCSDSSTTTQGDFGSKGTRQRQPTLKEQWIVWVDLNDEQRALEKLFGDQCYSVYGTLPAEEKEQRLEQWLANGRPILLSKPSVFGFGLNLQNCHNVIFVGVSHSYEAFYQAVRRSWRFGQTSPVSVYVVTSTAEGAVVSNLARKERDAQTMIDGMIAQTHEISTRILKAFGSETSDYTRDVAKGERWTAYLGDCVDVTSGLDADSIDYTIFSPPFASLYTYTDSDRDMGNVRDYTEFARHFRFLVKQLYRVTKPGRLVSFRCMDLPLTKSMGEEISLLDFPGYLIRMFQRAGFSWHSKVTIWKDPVTAMQRTHALGLLYKQLRKDSARSRQGVPDYLITMRKPGDNLSPVTKLEPTSAVVGQDEDGNDALLVPKSDEDYPEPYFPVELWQRYASPVWFDINSSDTLQRESAREAKDERHIAPLQKEVVRRAIRLWTNKGDLVLTPFLGIGTELFVAVEMGRRGVGAELKASYWRQAVKNLQGIEAQVLGGDLFSWANTHE